MKRRASAPYTSAEVCRLAGISFRQLDYWDRTHLFSPSVQSAAGSGSRRRYSVDDLEAVKLIAFLVDAGISLSRIRRDGHPQVTLRRLIDLGTRALEELSA